jgi:hypothetical protein
MKETLLHSKGLVQGEACEEEARSCPSDHSRERPDPVRSEKRVNLLTVKLWDFGDYVVCERAPLEYLCQLWGIKIFENNLVRAHRSDLNSQKTLGTC